MKRKAMLSTTVALLGLTVAGCASAAGHKGHHHHRGPVHDRAPVVDVRPIVRQVRVSQPQRECWNETHYQTVRHGGSDRVRSAGPTIAGGVIGGVVGRQFGGGSGRDAATLLGTLVGAAVANEHAHNRHREQSRYAYYEERPVTVERCSVNHVTYYEERVEGYDVTYLYGGREYTTRTSSHPGSHIRVRVDVKPAHRY